MLNVGIFILIGLCCSFYCSVQSFSRHLIYLRQANVFDMANFKWAYSFELYKMFAAFLDFRIKSAWHCVEVFEFHFILGWPLLSFCIAARVFSAIIGWNSRSLAHFAFGPKTEQMCIANCIDSKPLAAFLFHFRQLINIYIRFYKCATEYAMFAMFVRLEYALVSISHFVSILCVCMCVRADFVYGFICSRC